MAWFKVDDSAYDHAKFCGLPDSALALWVRAGVWSSRHLTDGVIPPEALRLFGRNARQAASILQARGLWESCGDGFRFHDWTDWQPSREVVESRRKAATERHRRWSQRRDTQQERVTESVANASQERVTNACVTPLVTEPRPDPTRNTLKSVTGAGGAGARANPPGSPAPAPATDPTVTERDRPWNDLGGHAGPGDYPPRRRTAPSSARSVADALAAGVTGPPADPAVQAERIAEIRASLGVPPPRRPADDGPLDPDLDDWPPIEPEPDPDPDVTDDDPF